MEKKYRNILIAIAIPTIYAIVLRLFFGFESFKDIFVVMSLSFLFVSPIGIGALSVYLSNEFKAKKISYRVFFPWIVILIFLIVTILFTLEGWACWLMALPLFLIASSLGGLLGGYLKLRKSKNKLSISFVLLLPFLLAPFESMVDSIPGTYEAYTYIDIKAPAEVIWSNVTRVKEIPEEQDKGYLNKALGFPRPVKAELDFEGVGAYREAIFTNGLIFHETVKEYIDNEKMVFSIKANPQEIPSTTLDEHVLIGGDYFDVLDGTYELEKLDNGMNRLHLYSHFEMNTTFNFYAGWWARNIMKDIQNNILHVQKMRSE